MDKKMNVLYISYDGATDPLGRSQIIPYLTGLARSAAHITLLSFEKPKFFNDRNQREAVSLMLKKHDIRWVTLGYHKNPKVLSTFYDILLGFFKILMLIKKDGIDFIHARSYIPAFIAYLVKKLKRVKYLFDMRGLWANEKVDAGIWPRDSWLYKITKNLERVLLLNSARIVVLTKRARNIIKNFDYMKSSKIEIDVIPTCVDLKKFYIQEKHKDILTSLDTTDKFILLYLGSIGTWYMLPEMVSFFRVIKNKVENSFFLFLANNGGEAIEYEMRKHNISNKDFLVKNISYQDVPQWLSVADASIFFIKPTFSKKGSCATKFGESLACGVPVIINSEIGDTDEIVKSCRVGIVIEKFNLDSYKRGVHELLNLIDQDNSLNIRCRDTASKLLSLDDGIRRFHKIYRSFMENQ